MTEEIVDNAVSGVAVKQFIATTLNTLNVAIQAHPNLKFIIQGALLEIMMAANGLGLVEMDFFKAQQGGKNV